MAESDRQLSKRTVANLSNVVLSIINREFWGCYTLAIREDQAFKARLHTKSNEIVKRT